VYANSLQSFEETSVLTSFLMTRVKRDSVPLLLFVLVFVVMSYPLVFQLDTMVPFLNGDTYHAIWHNWWVWEAFSNGQDFNFTPLLFAPNGLDYSLLPPRYLALPIWIVLYEVFGEPIAYNLSIVIEIILKAYGMYLFGLYLFKERIPAWVMGAFYAFGVISLQMALQQPYSGSTGWIPFFMLAYVYGFDLIHQKVPTKRMLWMMVLAGFLFTLSMYMNLKIGIFAMLIGGGYVLYVMVYRQLWRLKQFWQGMIVFTATVLIISSPLLYPFFVSGSLEDAVDIEARVQLLDVMTYVQHRLDRPLMYTRMIGAMNDDLGWPIEFQRMPTVGVVSIAFAFMGLLYAVRKDRLVLGWVLMGLVFWVFSLGSTIQIDGTILSEWAPASLLQDTIILGVLRNTQRFALVFWFPFAVLIGYGLHYRLANLTLNRNQLVLLTVSVVMLLYGTSVFPIPYRVHVEPEYTKVLNDLPSGSVVNLPLGRSESKYYMSIQRYHGRPMIEGMIARTPDGTYDYIDSLAAIDMWGASSVNMEADEANDAWRDSMQQLLDDGFRYIVLHKYVWASHGDRFTPDIYFRPLNHLPIEYEDNDVRLYDIQVLLNQPFIQSDSE